MTGESEPIRLGIVGPGGMGRIHADTADSFGHVVVAGADVDPTAREEFAKRHDPVVYEDVQPMLDAHTLDAVVVSTPNAIHEPVAVAVLERGLPVLCEKPLAHTLDSAERFATTAADSEGFCFVNFHNRISTAGTIFDEYRRTGRVGDVTHVETALVRRRGIPAGSWFTDP